MAKRARAMRAEGKDIISLSTGEPDFYTPEHIKEAAIKAIHGNQSYYTPVSGTLELKEAIVHKFSRDNQLDFNTNQIVVSTGAKHALMNLILSVVNPGDEVIIPSPYWVSYIEMVKFAGGVPIIVPGSIENDFKITAQQLSESISSRTVLFLYSSPCNPSGSVYSESELQSWAEVLELHPHILICSDEIYEHILFEGQHTSIAQIESMRSRTVIINGVSKGFAMTGWRLGYMAAPESIAKACEKLQGQFTSGANSIAQAAAIAALSNNLDATHHMTAEFKKRRDRVLELCSTIPGMRTPTPRGAFYLFPDISSYFGKQKGSRTITSDTDLAMYLLEEAHVATVQGSAFGSGQCIRISFATSELLLEEAFKRISSALEKLQ